MRWLLILLLLATPASARELWADAGFRLETAGWLQSQHIQDWIGLRVGLTLPPGGLVVLDHAESFRFWLPCKNKWVYDRGIIAVDGCAPTPRSGRDTLDGAVYVHKDMGCDQQGGRVLLIVRLPHMFPTKECRPTKVEWVNGGYYAED